MRRVRLPPTSSLCTLSLSASLTDLDMADRVRQLLATTCWSSIFLFKKETTGILLELESQPWYMQGLPKCQNQLYLSIKHL